MVSFELHELTMIASRTIAARNNNDSLFSDIADRLLVDDLGRDDFGRDDLLSDVLFCIGITSDLWLPNQAMWLLPQIADYTILLTIGLLPQIADCTVILTIHYSA